MAKALVITSFERNFHNYRDGIDQRLKEIWKDEIEIASEREDFEGITLAELQQYDCVVFYCAAAWGLKAKERFAVALASYIFQGGKVLLLHIMSFGVFAEGAQLFGGAFRMHPPYQKYTFIPADTEDEILQDMEPFAISDEAHLMHMERFLPKEMLLFALSDNGTAHAEGQIPHRDIYAQNSGFRIPLAWKFRLCKGWVFYSCLGHSTESFGNKSYVRFLQNSMRWLLSR